MNTTTDNRSLRIAALLAAATPITAAVFAFAPPAAAVPVAAASATQVTTPLGIAEDPCHFAVQFTALNTFKLPLCAGD